MMSLLVFKSNTDHTSVIMLDAVPSVGVNSWEGIAFQVKFCIEKYSLPGVTMLGLLCWSNFSGIECRY